MAQTPRAPVVPGWLSIGWILALVVLLLAIVLGAIGQMDVRTAALFVLLALARLIP